MASLAAVTPSLDPLQELQKSFCLFKLAGAFWVSDRREIEAVRNGASSEELSMYGKADGKLLL